MQNGAAILHGDAYTVGITDITCKHVEAAFDIVAATVQPSPGIEGVVEDEGADVISRAYQTFSQVRADETIGTSDQNLFQFGTPKLGNCSGHVAKTRAAFEQVF